MGLAQLPAPLVQAPPTTKVESPPTSTQSPALAPPIAIGQWDIDSPVTDMPRVIELDLAKSGPSERVWNYLVEQHHYLGHKVVVGRCLKYLVRSGSRLLGAIAFSSPAWQVKPRDLVLQELGFTTETIHERVLNNSRFLILPGIRVDHLASRVLALATKRVVEDWRWYYSVDPLVAETFVQPSKFDGTCYRAANWIEVGRTKGYAKVGPTHHNSQEPKQLFLYGLNRVMRAKLLAHTLDPDPADGS